MARPAKPLYVAPVDAAAADLTEGAMSLDDAVQFTSLCRSILRRAVDRGEIEFFHVGRRVLLVRKSVRVWLASFLAQERDERAKRELMQ